MPIACSASFCRCACVDACTRPPLNRCKAAAMSTHATGSAAITLTSHPTLNPESRKLHRRRRAAYPVLKRRCDPGGSEGFGRMQQLLRWSVARAYSQEGRVCALATLPEAAAQAGVGEPSARGPCRMLYP